MALKVSQVTEMQEATSIGERRFGARSTASAGSIEAISDFQKTNALTLADR
jgi:hypothetical protein